jgi:integrase
VSCDLVACPAQKRFVPDIELKSLANLHHRDGIMSSGTQGVNQGQPVPCLSQGDTNLQTKLTAALVRRHTEEDPPARDTSYFDTEVPRLALRVKPPRNGADRWASLFYIRYTSPDGRERRLKIGDPKTMKLDAARSAARAKLARVDTGGDPAADRAKVRADWSIAQAWEAYATSAEFAKKAARSQAEDAATAKLHIIKHVGHAKIAGVDIPLVRRLRRSVEQDQRVNKRKRKLGGPGAARRAIRVLSSCLSWSVGEGQLARNPIIGGIRLDGGGERSIILDQPEQYQRLFHTMDVMVEEGRLRAEVRAFVVVIAATGMRRNEVRGLRWGDVDLTNRRVVLSDPKGSKLSRRGPSTESLSLPAIAASALTSIRPDDALDVDQVFVPKRGHLMSVNFDWNRIRLEAQLPDGLVLHSLRHSIGTAGIVAGMSTAEVGKMLRHRNLNVTARYVHLAEASQSRLQDRAADYLMPAGIDKKVHNEPKVPTRGISVPAGPNDDGLRRSRSRTSATPGSERPSRTPECGATEAVVATDGTGPISRRHLTSSGSPAREEEG